MMAGNDQLLVLSRADYKEGSGFKSPLKMATEPQKFVSWVQFTFIQSVVYYSAKRSEVKSHAYFNG